MLTEHLKAALARVASWPEERQAQLAELALVIEAEMSKNPYQASSEELQAIDEAMAGGLASKEEIKAAYATFTHERGIREKRS